MMVFLILHFGSKLNWCPICGVKIKAKNIGHHLANVHPIYSFNTKEIQLSTRCIFCGETADVNSTRYNLQQSEI